MLALQFQGDLEGIGELGFKDSEVEPYFFTFKVECGACHEVHGNAVGFNAHEKVSLANSRGEANFSMKCKSCGKEGNVSVEAKFGTASSGASKPTTMASFDCRGLSLVEFIPDGPFWATGEESSTKFDVSFEDGEWYDYDEKAGQEVSITSTQWTIVKTK